MSLLELDINQCPDKYYVLNTFQGTDKCDHKSSYVSWLFIINVLQLLYLQLFFSVYPFLEEAIYPEVTNASANKAMNTHLRIKSLIMMAK